ncbi:MAG TPA: citrate synthase family protein [Polyangiaceae bacterium]|jgi:citrate synthase|nr:citrate synthase family protein [Polyangiaceae bacterium]
MDRVDQRGFDNQRSDLLSAPEAARMLGVKLETLYAYASRGLLRSERGPSGTGRRYARSEVERLKARREARAGHGPVAAGALRWGEPVLSTAISSIRADGPAYRGHSAVALARAGEPFESVAELLWSGALDRNTSFAGRVAFDALKRIRFTDFGRHPPLPSLLALVPRLSLVDGDRFGAAPEAERVRARTLVRAMVLSLARDARTAESAAAAESVAESMAIALGAPRRAREPLNLALSLLADHELNASTFAARVVASTGADLYAAVTGGLAALSGPLHGAFSDRVEAFLDEVGTPERAREMVQARASRGEAVPGFGHPLYPDGDPRVPPLLEAAERMERAKPRARVAFAVIAAMQRAGQRPPNVDFGLVALVRALGLSRGSGAAIFAIGRTAGWIAHALEQRAAGFLLRPRAEYTGP